ncbi:MAG: hypothetical protein JXA69_08770 [Phycisphaerae bacterium]|nr:hypothetical protein [Phycisphaerae bacterium]
MRLVRYRPPVAVFAVASLLVMASDAQGAETRAGITLDANHVTITAGPLVRTLDLSGNRILLTDLRVGETQIASGPGAEFRLTFHQAEPNRRPVGLAPGDVEPLDFGQANRDWLKATRAPDAENAEPELPITEMQSVQWTNPITLDGQRMAECFQLMHTEISTPRAGATRLNLRARVIDTAHPLHHVAISLFYEVHDGYPAIRKWIEITNNGPKWLKIDALTIDAADLSPALGSKVPLTPQLNGVGSSVVAFGNDEQSCGVIAASEVPSALRSIGPNGSMGYTDAIFEWVLGPSERFESEPVFQFAYTGEVEKTVSGVSTPLDRTVEGPYMRFLEDVVGMRATTENSPAPVWCSWANFKTRIDDANMREQAKIAARAGFTTFLIDAGWSKYPNLDNSEPDPARFPDFDATCRYITSTGLRLGLWICCMRNPGAQDLAALPDAVATPRVNRGGGLGMSFTSPWRDYFANDLVYMYDRFGMTYVKEDFSQILFGDVTEGHESRTHKESILRGLRGLLAANDVVAHSAPGLITQLTHEIYWATPGPGCDIALLKHCSSYHIPPNIYLGNPDSNKRVSQQGDYDPQKLRRDLIQGCWVARQQYFAHRGLPLYPLEFYSAETVNFKGSLSPEVQDRQVCSWLMGCPTVFSGDLASLTAEQVDHYRRRFELVKRLQNTYDIYLHFQYSGVPLPTDTDWHWWGKLDEAGCGAVVVLRGSGGAESRAINVPWVLPERSYNVNALLQGKPLGRFTAAQLRSGALALSLPAYGQEILELAAAPE